MGAAGARIGEPPITGEHPVGPQPAPLREGTDISQTTAMTEPAERKSASLRMIKILRDLCSFATLGFRP